jgi:hypothetical protein
MDEKILLNIHRELTELFHKRSDACSDMLVHTMSLERNIGLTGHLYHEIVRDRILQVQIDPESEPTGNIRYDFWFSNFRFNEVEHRFLTIDLKSLPVDFELLWKIRRKWLSDWLEESEMQAFLKSEQEIWDSN